MLQVFRSGHPIAYFWLLVFTVVLHGGIWFASSSTDVAPHFLFQELFEKLHALPDVFYNLLFLLAIYLTALLNNYFFTHFRLVPYSSLIPAFVFVLVSACLIDHQYAVGFLFSLFPLILGLLVYFNACLKEESSAIETTFFGAFIVGIFAVLYIPAYFLLPILLLISLIFRGPIGRELFMATFGFFLPLLYLMAFAFLTDQLPDLQAQLQWYALDVAEIFRKTPLFYGLFVVLLLLSFWGIGKSSQLSTQNIILHQKFVRALSFLTLLSFLHLLILPKNEAYTGILFLAFPLSLFIGTHYLNNKTPLGLKFILWAGILGALVWQFGHFIFSI